MMKKIVVPFYGVIPGTCDAVVPFTPNSINADDRPFTTRGAISLPYRTVLAQCRLQVRQLHLFSECPDDALGAFAELLCKHYFLVAAYYSKASVSMSYLWETCTNAMLPA